MDSKLVFARALEELLRTKTLEGVTIGDLVAASGLSKSNFYNHFTDKYDLANWRHRLVHDRHVADFLEGRVSYRDLVRESLEGIADYQDIYAHSLESSSYEAPRAYIGRISLEATRAMLAAGGIDVDEPGLALLIEMFTAGTVDAMFRWIHGDVALSADELAAVIERALPAELAGSLHGREGHAE